MCVCACVCISIYTHIHICVCMYDITYVYMCVCVILHIFFNSNNDNTVGDFFFFLHQFSGMLDGKGFFWTTQMVTSQRSWHVRNGLTHGGFQGLDENQFLAISPSQER